MRYKNLLGCKLDTNQFTSKTIENVQEAKMYVEKAKKIYGDEILKYMFLTSDKRYTTFQKDGISLYSILN